MKVRDVIRMVEDDGWFLVRITGSHRHFKHPDKAGVVTIPGHPSKDMPPGTLNSVRKQAGVEMSEALRYAVVFERSEDGYGVFVPDLPDVSSLGDTLEEAQANIREAIEGHLSVMREFGDPIPQPTTLTQYVEVSTPQQMAS